MRILLLLLLILPSFQLVSAQGPAQGIKDRALTQRVETLIKLSADPLNARQQKIVQALRKEAIRSLRTISWEDYLREADIVAQQWIEFQEKESAITSDLLALPNAKKALEEATTSHEGTPNYAQETKGVKYIYLAESTDHGSYSIPAEVANLLRDIRKHNPQARMLLATEFAVRNSRFQAPICFAAHAPCRLHSSQGFYGELHQKALALSVDLLGLDDYSGDTLWPQIGETYISYSIESPLLQAAVADYPSNLLPRHVVTDMAGSSHWGVNQRNAYWTHLIQAVAPYYDIIITYAGNGHLIYGPAPLPELLAQPYALISFSSSEQIPDADFYETRNQNRLDIDASADKAISSSMQQLVEQMESLPGKEDENNYIDINKNFYIKDADIKDPVLEREWNDLYRSRMGKLPVPNSFISVSLQQDPRVTP